MKENKLMHLTPNLKYETKLNYRRLNYEVIGVSPSSRLDGARNCDNQQWCQKLGSALNVNHT